MLPLSSETPMHQFSITASPAVTTAAGAGAYASVFGQRWGYTHTKQISFEKQKQKKKTQTNESTSWLCVQDLTPSSPAAGIHDETTYIGERMGHETGCLYDYGQICSRHIGSSDSGEKIWKRIDNCYIRRWHWRTDSRTLPADDEWKPKDVSDTHSSGRYHWSSHLRAAL